MSWISILDELGRPMIYQLPPKQFEWVEGDKIHGLCGNSSVEYPVVTIHPGLRGKVRANTIYHEIGHKLFPSRPHWWIDLFGERMARGGGRGYWATKYGKTLDDIQPRARLVVLSRRASKRLNKKTTTRRRKARKRL